MKKSKRNILSRSKLSQSNIISSVLLILIVIMIAMIIANYSFGFINKKQKESEGFSFNYKAEIAEVYMGELASGPSPEESPEIEVLVRRVDTGNEVNGVRFIFEDNQGNEYTYDDEDNLPNSAGRIYKSVISESDIGTAFNNLEQVSIRFLYDGGVTEILDEKII